MTLPYSAGLILQHPFSLFHVTLLTYMATCLPPSSFAKVSTKMHVSWGQVLPIPYNQPHWKVFPASLGCLSVLLNSYPMRPALCFHNSFSISRFQCRCSFWAWTVYIRTTRKRRWTSRNNYNKSLYQIINTLATVWPWRIKTVLRCKLMNVVEEGKLLKMKRLGLRNGEWGK